MISLRSLIFITIIFLSLAMLSFYYFDLSSLSLALSLRQQSPFIDRFGQWVQQAFTFRFWLPFVILYPILITCYLKMVKRWTACSQIQPILQFSLGTLISMGLCFIVKVLVGRYRPELYLTHQLFGFHSLSLQSFSKDLQQSMPSDHSAIIFSIVTWLNYQFRLRSYSLVYSVLLYLVAILLLFTRITLLRHYPSDVIVGALIGIWGAYLAYYFYHRSSQAT